MNRLFSLIFFLVCTTTLSGQVLTLPEAINIALRNSLDIQLVKNNLQISNLNNSAGIAGGLPVVTATGSDNEQSVDINQNLSQKISGRDSSYHIQRKGAVSNQLSAGVGGNLLLYNGLRVVATRQRLAELEKQSREYVASQIQTVIAGVMTSYYDVVRQQGYIKTIDQSIDVARQKLEIIKAQQNVGLANNADLFQAQLDLNNLLQTKQSQLLVIEQSKTSLLSLLTLRPDSSVAISDTIIVDRSVVLGNVLDSLHSSPDFLAAAGQVRINQIIEKETAAQRYPTVRVSAGYNYTRNQATAGQILLNQLNGPFAGFNFIIPIYNGSVYKRQQQIAGVNTRNAGLQEKMLLRDNQANAVRTYQAYTSALLQLETAQKNVVLARQLLDLVLQRFQYRQNTIVEVTIAEQSFETAAYSLINLSYAAKAAEVELNRLTGRLSPLQ